MTYLQMRDIHRSFGGVQALKGASLAVDQGSIHALCGGNGAGKSTLMRILAGADRPDRGLIQIGREEFTELSPGVSTQMGIGIVHQEFALVPELTVYENVFLGVEKGRLGLPDRAAMKAAAAEIFSRMGEPVDVNQRVGMLRTGKQQLVEIAKALSRGSSILIFDEPTAALDRDEKQRLFAIMRELRDQNHCLIFISHFINEVFDVCDSVSVVREGRTVLSKQISNTSADEIITAMVGNVSPAHRGSARAGGEVVVSLHNAGVVDAFDDVSLHVRAGEIVGLAGLIGSGAYEIAETVFGMRRLSRGSMRLRGEDVVFNGPSDAVEAGIGYVPEDRKAKGLWLELAASINVALPSLSSTPFSRAGIINANVVREQFRRLGQRLRLQPLNPNLPASAFSGGGQQKLVVARWLAKRCSLYVLLEPTRGVDVAAKAEILNLVQELRSEGAAVLLISTEFDEIVTACDRCYVFAKGKVVAQLAHSEISIGNLTTHALAPRARALGSNNDHS